MAHHQPHTSEDPHPLNGDRHVLSHHMLETVMDEIRRCHDMQMRIERSYR